MMSEQYTPPRPPFRLSGIATVKHLGIRKEGPEDDKIIAVDVKLEVKRLDRRLCRHFDDAIETFLWRGDTDALIVRIKARKTRYRTWCANLAVNMHGMALSKQVLRDHFKAAKARAQAAHPELAAEIADFWFYDLRTKASTDVQALRGLQDAADLLGHASTKTTLENYSPKGKVTRPTK